MVIVMWVIGLMIKNTVMDNIIGLVVTSTKVSSNKTKWMAKVLTHRLTVIIIKVIGLMI